MQRDQWKTASEQLLAHWQRSGITQLPKVHDASISLAKNWLQQNAEAIYTDSSVAPSDDVSIPSVVSKTVAQPESMNSIAERVSESHPLDSNPERSPAPAFPPLARPSASGNEPQIQVPWLTQPQDFVARQSSLLGLSEQVAVCKKCEVLACRRQRTVFGCGPVNARVVMFGEAPGADEDRVGEPFVGAAGQLLDKIMIASGLKRSDVYIMNALKCRPPNNRTPTEAEIEQCRPYFETQLETIQPEYIVCWGAVAVRAVLRNTESIGRLRGRFHAFRGAKVLVTYHPAYLLRTPDAKRLTWDDMKMLMRDMGIPIPGKS